MSIFLGESSFFTADENAPKVDTRLINYEQVLLLSR
jgi:hypothetical protein